MEYTPPQYVRQPKYSGSCKQPRVRQRWMPPHRMVESGVALFCSPDRLNALMALPLPLLDRAEHARHDEERDE